METLDIEDLKRILNTITNVLNKNDYDPSDLEALTKAENILTELIKDKEFEKSRNPLPY